MVEWGDYLAQAIVLAELGRKICCNCDMKHNSRNGQLVRIRDRRG